MMVADDNLRQDENKNLLFTEQKEQCDEWLSQTAYLHNWRVVVNHAAWTQCFEF